LETGRRVEGLIDFIAERYESAAEIGIGHFPDVALGLLGRGVDVFATDIKPYVHEGLDVLIDDVTAPDLFLYQGIHLIYSMRTPAELVPYMARLAKTISADVIIKPLSSEYPEGWKLIRHRNASFFLFNKSRLSAVNLMYVIPACLESFLRSPADIQRRRRMLDKPA
jgi:uncharacterized protein